MDNKEGENLQEQATLYDFRVKYDGLNAANLEIQLMAARRKAVQERRALKVRVLHNNGHFFITVHMSSEPADLAELCKCRLELHTLQAETLQDSAQYERTGEDGDSVFGKAQPPKDYKATLQKLHDKRARLVAQGIELKPGPSRDEAVQEPIEEPPIELSLCELLEGLDTHTLGQFDNFLDEAEMWWAAFGETKAKRIGFKKDFDTLRPGMGGRPIVEIEVYARRTENGVFWYTNKPILLKK